MTGRIESGTAQLNMAVKSLRPDGKLIEAGRLPLNRGYVRAAGTGEEQIRWAMILPLKNREVRKKRFWERTGASVNEVFRPKIERLKAHGLA